MSDEISKNIQQEINKTGLPLELRVANYLRSEQYYVHHSAYGKGSLEQHFDKNIFM